jgi:nucleoside-triphosphatase
MESKNLLVTGPPRCGKSTLIERLAMQIRRPLTGFFTREIREKGVRAGFSIEPLEGKKGILAHIKSRSPRKLGRYGVNLEEFESLAIPAMIPSGSDQIIIIDEIGKMECFSPRFREALIHTLDLPNPVISSIAQKGTPFIEKIKERNDVLLVTISEENRDSLPAFLLHQMNGVS